MVVRKAGDPGHDRTLTQYVGPTEIVMKHGHMIVYDSGSDTVIAELSQEAADAVRSHKSLTLRYDGDGNITLENP